MKNYNNPTSIRLNPDREKDLIEFIESSGGVKKALLILFNHYKVTKDLPHIIQQSVENAKQEVQDPQAQKEGLGVVKKLKELVDLGILNKEEFYEKVSKLF